MLNSLWIIIPVSIMLGILSGLGTGGGSLLIIWLTIAVGIDQADARVINLMFFLPSAFISCLFRWKHGNFNLKQLLPAIICGSIAAVVFSWVSIQMNVELLKKLFGVLLLFTGIRELFYRPRNPR